MSDSNTEDNMSDYNSMFGVQDEAALEAMFQMNRGPRNPQMLAMSILSDAQEMMAAGDAESARQYINRAKWVISEKLWGWRWSSSATRAEQNPAARQVMAKAVEKDRSKASPELMRALQLLLKS